MRRKRILSFALVVVMLFGITVPAFAEADTSLKQFDTVMAMGDSNACGCNLEGYNFFTKVKGSYPEKVAEAVGASTFYPMRAGGLRISDVLYMLGNAPSDFDEENAAIFHAESSLEGVSIWKLMQEVKAGDNEMIGDPVEAVKNSDLITIAFGAVELGYYPLYQSILDVLAEHPELADSFNTNTVDEVVAEASVNEETSEESSDDSSETLKLLAEFGLSYVKLAQKGYNELLRNYPKLLTLIRKLNPDATICLVGIFNPYNSLSLGDDSGLNIGKAITATFDSANAYIKSLAVTYGCKFADVSDIYDYDLSTGHPQQEGYDYIASQILSVLPAAEKRVYVPFEGDIRVELAGTDIGTLNFERTASGFKLKDSVNGCLCVEDGKLSYCEDGGTWWYDGGFYTVGKVKVTSQLGFSYPKIQRYYLTVQDGTMVLSTERTAAEMYVKA